VVKYDRVFQTLFYMLGFKRELICFRDTNKLEWKKALTHLDTDHLFNMIKAQNPFGPKAEEYLVYQKMKFLEKNLEGIDADQVDEYSVALGKLLRWMQYYLELRKEDVISRQEHTAKLKEEREAATVAFEERDKNRNNDLETAQAVSNLNQLMLYVGI
jgi:hypothetical protein